MKARFIWSRRGEFPVTDFDPVVHQSQQGERFWDSHDYCNNFIFRPL